MLKTKKRDHAKFVTLLKYLDLMKDMFSEEEIKFSPYLHPDKTAREKLSKYPVLSMDLNSLSLTVYKIKFVARFLKSLLIPIIYHLYNRPTLKFSNQILFENIDTIFVSHYTHKEISVLDQDFYFGDLPKRTKDKSSQNLVLYINHTRDRSMQPSDSHTDININPMKILLPKTTSNKIFIQFYLNQIKLFYRICLKAKKNSKKSVIQKIFLYELALQQFNQPAFIQQCLIHNILEICKKSEPRKIMLTYEGHSYETFLVRKIDKHFVNIEIGVYQFSPPVSAQISFFKNLELLPSKVVIYVSGEYPANQIISLTSLGKNRIQVLGSHKNNGKSFSMLAKSNKLTVLFAPEGSKSSLSELVTLLGHCIESLPDINFVLRLHPASFRYAQKILDKSLGSNSNKFLSKNNLENDLKAAHICIYKSSVVGIQGLQYGVVPFHFSCLNSGATDPISDSDRPHQRFESHEKLINELKTYYKKTGSQRINLSKNLSKEFKKYLSPINTKIIL
jgi:hypothetical protein